MGAESDDGWDDRVTCPRCAATARMGLPRSAAIEATRTEPDSALADSFLADSGRHKCRQITCPNDHQVYVYFAF